MLSDEEQMQILDALWSETVEGPNGYPKVNWGIDFPVVESIVAAHRREAWNECCRAFAWAMFQEPNNTPVSWLEYVQKNNPYGDDNA
jgi:hypothetical protein